MDPDLMIPRMIVPSQSKIVLCHRSPYTWGSMTVSMQNRFLSQCEPILPLIEHELGEIGNKNNRRAAVRLLIDRLALQFGAPALLNQQPIIKTPAQIEPVIAPLLEFPFDSDERNGISTVTPEILGALVERYAADRAGLGAYYTPAKIVAHICRNTLEIVLGVKRDRVVELSVSEKRALAIKLGNINIVDPACGCGAFLVGMVYELTGLKALLGSSSGEILIPAQLSGTDLDELAVHTARIRVALATQSVAKAQSTDKPTHYIAVGDGLESNGEVGQCGEYDVVVTNPPFGVTIATEVRDRFFDSDGDGAQSRDAYGIFVARSLELLRPGGVAGLLISGTWRTIRRHRPLRKQLAEKTRVCSLVDLPSWIFPATVNTGILTIENEPATKSHEIVTADLQSIAKGNWSALEEQLANGARSSYPQQQVGECDNFSFFIASPRLHRIVTDSRYTTLGEIATVRQGLATGDNKRYLRKKSQARGNYQIVDLLEILSEDDLGALSTDEKLNGVEPTRYNGRKFVPYDKGGASSSSQGWLPNYYVPTEYFIDWSQSAVERMKTATSARQRGKIASRFQNSEQYFKRGITFSYTGFYSPCFRLSSGGVFDVGGSSCFDLQLPLYPTLAMLASKLLKYVGRNFINHTVNFQVDDFKALPLPRELAPATSTQLEALVAKIVAKQKIEPRYPYHRHEQIEIDRLVYQAFELTEEDIREVAGWYGQRYGRLSAGLTNG